MKRLFYIFILLFIAEVALAQNVFNDKLTKRTGETINCRIKEVGDDEIKYLLEGYREDIVFGIDKNKVKQIVFGDGREMTFEDSMFGSGNYTLQNHHALKIKFFSPLYDYTAISYERSLKPGRSIETELGIIGLGRQMDGFNASGAYLSFGYKFIKDPDFYFKGMRYAHILKGAYFKPELALSIYKYSNETLIGSNDLPRPNKNAQMYALILNVGKQWIFSDRFLVDWYVGAGYGFGKNNNGDTDFHFAFIGGGRDLPLVFNSGFRIGFLF